MKIIRSLILMIVVSHMGSNASFANEIPTASQMKELPPPQCYPEYWTDRDTFYAGLKARLNLSLMENNKKLGKAVISLKAGAIVYVNYNSDQDIHIVTMHDNRARSVQVQPVDGKCLDLNLGMSLKTGIASNRKQLAFRNITRISKSEELSEISTMSLVCQSNLLKLLFRAEDKTALLIRARILKTIASLDSVTRSRGPFLRN